MMRYSIKVPARLPTRWQHLGLLLSLLLGLQLTACAETDATADQPPDVVRSDEADSDTGLGIESTSAETNPTTSNIFISLVVGDDRQKRLALDIMREDWEPNYTTMAVETSSLIRDPTIHRQLIQLLEEKTGLEVGYDPDRIYQTIWQQGYAPNPDYAAFKSYLYGLLSPVFSGYFSNGRKSLIRLDEVRWGGVLQDGIPPLRQPEMLIAQDADYLDDSNVVFGVAINGDVRAYPKRILAWHEMFVDEIGGVPIVGVYCTLCGTVIIYDSKVNGVQHDMGTSGFLYRSNKLMYDRATQSLWSTFEGRPVIGPLVDQGIKLPHRSVVTTTWGEWKKRHPETTVLSLNTGYERDYGEGVAYQNYFATDDLMFSVPELDRRLKNKDEVLGLVWPQAPNQPLALSVTYLDQHPIYHDQIGDQRFVALTDTSGAIRVFDSTDVTFKNWDRHDTAIDTDGKRWTLTEAELTTEDGKSLARLPANRAFWFGWYSSYTHTRLVH